MKPATQAPPRRTWTNDEVGYLRQHYGAVSVSAIAQHLSRTVGEVNMRIIVLDLKPQALAAPEEAPVQEATPEVEVAPLLPEPASQPVRRTFGLHARAEELAAHWGERELGAATPNELAEILTLLRQVPASRCTIDMSIVLRRAESEQGRRQLAAGKGGRRG